MNPKLKEKWVAALRSGKYKQGQFALKDAHNTYCCLGVLHEIADGSFDDLPENGLLPNTTAKLAGLTGTKPNCIYEEVSLRNPQRKLAILNDDKGYDFNQIATWIEENL